MGPQEGNQETSGPKPEEELDCFEQLAMAVGNWEPDTSGDKKAIWLHSYDIVLRTREPLGFVVGFLEYHKSCDFANSFEGKFRQLYKEVEEFYDKVLRDEFGDYESFNLELQELENAAHQLALYVVRVKAMCEYDAASDRPNSDGQEGPPRVRISLRDSAIFINSIAYAPIADSVAEFLEELLKYSEWSEAAPKAAHKGQVDMLRKMVGKESLRHIIVFSSDGYRLHPNVKVRR